MCCGAIRTSVVSNAHFGVLKGPFSHLVPIERLFEGALRTATPVCIILSHKFSRPRFSRAGASWFIELYIEIMRGFCREAFKIYHNYVIFLNSFAFPMKLREPSLLIINSIQIALPKNLSIYLEPLLLAPNMVNHCAAPFKAFPHAYLPNLTTLTHINILIACKSHLHLRLYS